MFSYTLVLALVLLLPGFCAWGGLRLVERTDLLTPRPDKPNSTSTLLVIVVGALAGHLFGALVFALQAVWCGWTRACIRVAFDPNVYRLIFEGVGKDGPVTDAAIFAWLLELVLVGVAVAVAAYGLARSRWVKDRWDILDFGWLSPAVRSVKAGDAVIIAYVMTKTSDAGASVAYEGIVQQLALDDDQTITMLVLRNVDRFLIRVTGRGIERVDQDQEPIAQMQFHLAEIANVALEILERPSDPAPAP